MNGMSDDWAVSCDANTDTAILRGVMRLPSPDAYGTAFQPVREALLATGGEPYTIDVREVLLMNSSGIRALGTLVLAAGRAGVPLVIRGRRDALWQRKSLTSLQGLHPALTIEMEAESPEA